MKQNVRNKKKGMLGSILLVEYQKLIETLSCLDEVQFQTYQSETKTILDSINQWFNDASANATVEICSAMEQLRQKVRINHTQKHASKSCYAENPTVTVNLFSSH